MSISNRCTDGVSLFNSTMAPSVRTSPAPIARPSRFSAERPQLQHHSSRCRVDKPLRLAEGLISSKQCGRHSLELLSKNGSFDGRLSDPWRPRSAKHANELSFRSAWDVPFKV